MTKCWVVGPIAWDWPYKVRNFPSSGQFAQAERMPGRLGGTGANVARALASRYSPVGMIGYVGSDEYAERSLSDLQSRGIDTAQVQALPGDTSQVLLFIEPSGERTIVGVAADCLSTITIRETAISPGDLVYFAAWRDEFEPALRHIGQLGGIVASVPFAKPSQIMPVSYVVGSVAEVPHDAEDAWESYYAWTGGALRYVTLTWGARGVRLLSPGGCRELPAIAVDAVDATGAGDAFAAAVLAAVLEGRPILSGAQEGLAWGAATAGSDGSIPPAWRDVVGAGRAG